MVNVGAKVEKMLREYGEAAVGGGAILSAVVGGKVCTSSLSF